jgi:hypothetical protein
VGLWSEAMVGLRSRAGGLEIPRSAEQWHHRPKGQGLACSTNCSVNRGVEKPSMS